jgi:hypothetical protein
MYSGFWRTAWTEAHCQARYPTTLNPPSQTQFYPQWGRSCPKAHRTPGNQANAGFPDFLLYMSPAPKQNAAIIEVKTWWAYPDRVFTGIFSTVGARRGSGEFDWTNQQLPATLLKQVFRPYSNACIKLTLLFFSLFF